MENNKYINGKIYTVRSHHMDKYYIGSTPRSLSTRLAEHKYKRAGQVSELFLYDDVYIELLENFPCNSKDELRKREGELIRENKHNVLNTRVDGRTKEENQKEYYKNNQKNILDELKVKIKCPVCNLEVNRSSFKRHSKSKYCKTII